MTVYVHNDAFEITENTSVALFIADILKKEISGMALAINEIIIPNNKWDDYILQEKDRLLIIRPVAGG